MPKATDVEAAIWKAAESLPIVGPWVTLVKPIRDLFGGDQVAARKAIRAFELAERKRNDRRLGR